MLFNRRNVLRAKNSKHEVKTEVIVFAYQTPVISWKLFNSENPRCKLPKNSAFLWGHHVTTLFPIHETLIAWRRRFPWRLWSQWFLDENCEIRKEPTSRLILISRLFYKLTVENFFSYRQGLLLQMSIFLSGVNDG